MKKCISILLAVLLLMLLCPTALAAGDDIQVAVNGTLVIWTDAVPFIDENGRTLVPLRAVAEALGLDVAWDADRQEAVFSRTDELFDGPADMVLRFPIGSTTATYDSYIYGNGTGTTLTNGTLEMDTAAVIVNGRTYAPVRYLAEFFNWNVAWNNATKTVYIGTYSLLDGQDFTGYYKDSFNGMVITPAGDGYQVNVFVYRLTGLSGTGTVQNGVLVVDGTVDADGSAIRFTIQETSPGEILLTIADSTWVYLHNGDTLTFYY